MNPSDKTLHIVPPDEMRCVWMTAGVISYQLCDREFECDECPLDAAFRNHVPRTTASYEEKGGRKGPGHIPDGALPDDRLYSKNHCWTKRIGDNLMQMGIEPGLGGALLAPKAIVFPSAGQRIFRGQTSLWIVIEGGTLPLESPLDGVILNTNTYLAGQPHLVSSGFIDKAWLLEMESDAASVEEAALMTREQAESKYGLDQDKFMSYLQNAASGGHHAVGVTLADGGQRLQNIADLIGSHRYFAILRKAFC